MAPPKKGIKMDIGSFLADESLGGSSWADEEVDLTSIEAYKSTTAAPIGNAAGTRGASGGVSSGWGVSDSSTGTFSSGERRERKEYPIPDQPPYRARVGNLPWDGIVEDDVVRYFEDRMQAKDIISDVRLPTDRETGKLRGFAFITFSSREVLEESLNLNLSEFNGRRIFVNVAAPQKAEEGDWKRSGPLGGRREEPQLDWGSARNTQAALPPRERSFRGERGERGDRPERPRREEPELDWGSARTTHGTLPPRERSFRGGDRPERSERPRKEEPGLDWGSARASHGTLPPRERSFRERSDRPKKQEPELDWGSARSSHSTLPPREKSNRFKKEEPELDWKRGQPLQTRKTSSAGSTSKEEKKSEQQPKPQQSSYSVLASLEGDDTDSEEEEQTPVKQEVEESVSQLETQTANLSVSDVKEDTEGWEVVGK